MTIASFRKVTKSYGALQAVTDFSLDITAGKFITLLGPSGCGKSTTLRLLGGFEQPDSGQIILCGRDITHLSAHKRNVNTVFQDYALFPHLTIAQNIAFGLEMKGLDKQVITKEVDRLLEMVQLQDYHHRLPAEISGGQKQRVALVRALAPDPQLLLLDEPLSALDAKLRQQMQIELKSIQKNTGKSFIFVTHDQEEALTMSDEIVLMNQGVIEQKGTPLEIYHHPQTAFAANFIGDINMLEVQLLSYQEDLLLLDWQGITLKAVPQIKQVQQNLKAGDKVFLLIRPEILQMADEIPVMERDNHNCIEVIVENLIFKGTQTSLLLRSPQGVKLDMLIHTKTSPINLGDKIKIGWPLDRTTIIAR